MWSGRMRKGLHAVPPFDSMQKTMKLHRNKGVGLLKFGFTPFSLTNFYTSKVNEEQFFSILKATVGEDIGQYLFLPEEQ